MLGDLDVEEVAGLRAALLRCGRALEHDRAESTAQ